MRDRSIDVFRGLAVVQMFFFSLINFLCPTLPNSLQHNIPDSLHFGDLVLPFFLFSSGMSLVFFERKRLKIGNTKFVLNILHKIWMLLLVSAIITPFSARGWFRMDEIMLNTVLFVPALLMVGSSKRIQLGAIVSTFLVYALLLQLDLLPDFKSNLFGGYAGAIYFLPLLLGGIVIARDIQIANLRTILVAISATLLLSAFVDPVKLKVTPSFIMLAITACIVLLYLIRQLRLESPILEYIGSRPLRYWLFMFMVLIPIMLFMGAHDGQRPFVFGWVVACVFSILVLAMFYCLSKLLDLLVDAVEKRL